MGVAVALYSHYFIVSFQCFIISLEKKKDLNDIEK